jgi:outer membrane murein-binding lipoprotein Lpp
MADTAQTILTVSVPTLAVLIGILVNNARLSDLNSRLSDLNKRIDELRADIDRRFDAMEKLFTEKLLRVEQVMDARIKHLEENR